MEKSLTHFCGSSPADWHEAVCLTVRDNTKAGNSVKQTSSVMYIRGCAHLPLQQVFKIIMSPDSTFYNLHSDIYFAKVLSLAMRVRTIFGKTPLKVYSTLKRPNGLRWQATISADCHGNLRSHFKKIVCFVLFKEALDWTIKLSVCCHWVCWHFSHRCRHL